MTPMLSLARCQTKRRWYLHRLNGHLHSSCHWHWNRLLHLHGAQSECRLKTLERRQQNTPQMPNLRFQTTDLPPFLLIESEEKVSNWHSSGLVEGVYSFSRFSVVIVSLLETWPTESQNAPARVKQLEAKSRQRHKGHPPFWRDPNLLIRTMV